MRRETCICEQPMRSAIWVWVKFSKNRSISTLRWRSDRRGDKRTNRLDVEHTIQIVIDLAESLAQRTGFAIRSDRHIGRTRRVIAAGDQRLDNQFPVQIEMISEF